MHAFDSGKRSKVRGESRARTGACAALAGLASLALAAGCGALDPPRAEDGSEERGSGGAVSSRSSAGLGGDGQAGAGLAGGGSDPPSGGGGDGAGASGTGGDGGGAGGGTGGAAPACPPADCTFQAQPFGVHIVCGPRAPIADVAPGTTAAGLPMRLAVTDHETLLAVGSGCGTDFARLAHGESTPSEVLSTPLDASLLALTTRKQSPPGASVAYLGVAPDAARAGLVDVDNLGGLWLAPPVPLVAFTGNDAAYYHSVSVAAPPDGTVHAVFDDRHFANDGIGWSELAPRLHLGYDPVSTIDATGLLVTFWAVTSPFGAGATIAMTRSGSSITLGDPGVLAYRAVPPPADFLAPPAPTTAVVLQDAAGLYVVWPEANGEGRAVLPASTLHRSCWSDDGPYIDESGCEEQSCEEHTSGVLRGAFATARAPDGSVWVAYVMSNLDVQVAYGGEIQGSCNAQRVLATDHSTATLHVVRVPLDGDPPEEVFTHPCAEPGTDYTGVDPVLLQAFGTQVVVAVAAFDPANALARSLYVIETADLPSEGAR